MRLCRRSWFFWLIFSISIFLSFNSYAFLSKYWSSVVMRFNPDKLEENNKKDDAISTNCRLTGSKETDGYPDLPRQYSRVTFAWNSMIIDYGKDIKEFAGFKAQWVYAERFPFSDKLNSVQSQKIQSLIKKALSEDKCDIAQALSDSLQEPQFTDEGNLYIKNGDDYCGMTNSGQTVCNFEGPAEQCDDDGKNCHITIGNTKQGTFEDYINSREKSTEPKDNTPDSSSSNSGSSSSQGDSSSSNGGSSSSQGDSSSGSNSQGNNQGSNGDNQGSNGSGNGVGNGSGDKEGDGNDEGKLPELTEFDIKKSLLKLKSTISDLASNSKCNISGECPSIDFSLFGTVHSIDVHCKLFSENGEGIRSGFVFLWTFIGILIILSS